MIKILRKFNKKLDEREKYLSSHQNLPFNASPTKTIWFHASSMGEFEQAKPIIELLKEKYPEIKIIVSFFSPSGFNTQKNYKNADYICYLPFDTLENADKFVRQIKPDLAIFIRYDIWRNYLKVLKNKGIPTFLINATQPSNKLFRNFYITRNFIKSNMLLFSEIITVDRSHTNYFLSIGLKNVKTLTDTRFDRIADYVNDAKSRLIFPTEFLKNKNQLVLVAGSIWKEDVNIIVDCIEEFNMENGTQIKVIYVPHEPNQENIQYIKSKVKSFVLLSEIIKNIHDGQIMQTKNKLLNSDVIVDSIGYLLRLYNYADFAYVGGAFGAGIHSVTEPAGYGIPIVTGPNLSKSSDAIILRNQGALTSIHSKIELKNWIKKIITDLNYYQKTSEISSKYIFDSIGSSKKVFELIGSTINLT